MFKNPKLSILCDIVAVVACAVMLVQDIRIAWFEKSPSFTVTMPDESGDVTEVADIAGNEDA